MSEKPTGKRYRMIKMVEARRLNPKSGIPLTEPPTAIPFGGLLYEVREERDLYKFTYLGKPYQCLQSILQPAMELFDGGSGGADAQAEGSSVAFAADPLPPPVAPVAAAEPAPFQWEQLPTSHGPLLRAKLPGGWMVMTGRGTALVFYPDPQHKWDGATLD
ncbi:MAG: hypothetical protein KJZ84_13730 [Bryobacteraceae bacterium]|nr:hypothetical protein [Bryobacteraceae bacterium]